MKTFTLAILAVLALATPMVSAQLCSFCEPLVEQGIVYCENAQTEQQVETMLTQYCEDAIGSSGFGKTICDLLVKEGVEYVWEVIKNGGSPQTEAREVCACIGLCPGKCIFG